MPSEKEIVQRVLQGTTITAGSVNYGGSDPAWASAKADAVVAALSAAEKEREGERETCFELTCEKVATHDAPIDGHGRCLYCAEHAEGVPGARRLVREGDIIEKLRESNTALAEASEALDHAGSQVAASEAHQQVLATAAFLNDLQEQSTGGEG